MGVEYVASKLQFADVAKFPGGLAQVAASLSGTEQPPGWWRLGRITNCSNKCLHVAADRDGEPPI